MSYSSHPSKIFMDSAIKEALKAKQRGDYPFGAILVQGNEIVAKASDNSKTSLNPIGHCVLRVIRLASTKLKSKNTNNGWVIYTTHEPCPMCATAVVWANIECLVVGSSMADTDEYSVQKTNINYLGQVLNIPAVTIIDKSPHQILMINGFMKEECKSLLQI